ncbi:MAG: 2-C-methyl-D-erythritol 4-phosphate cytidylyltransferase [Simkaniaceae bacterium]
MRKSAILLLAGNGTRFKSDKPKQYTSLLGRPLFSYALNVLIESQAFDEIILVTSPKFPLSYPGIKTVQGGSTRQASSFKGLLACHPETDTVLIHEGVRPFLTLEMIAGHLKAAKTYSAINTCIPSTDTLIYSECGQTIQEIPNRNHLLRGQTPQTFHYPLILKAHKTTKIRSATDDCQLLISQNHPVHILPGTSENIKITHPFDLKIAEQILKNFYTKRVQKSV